MAPSKEKEEELRLLLEQGEITSLDLHFGLFMERLAGSPFPGLSRAAALVSRATREGHICLDLFAAAPALSAPRGWIEKLVESPVVGRPDEGTPLILDEGGRLYLRRYWDYQESLRQWISARVAEEDEPHDLHALGRRLSRLFPPDGAAGPVDRQMVSAFIAATKRLAVISGGPGTGKTTTASKILALLLEQTWPAPLRIVLAAPTGKGAARLQEAVRRSRGSIDCAEEIQGGMPGEAFTLHRLLGPVKGSPYFRHHARNPLAVDVVVVDEASMVDLALLSKLVQALPPWCRLILLGDKDQLASVEAGAVLGDLCDTGRSHGYSRGFCDRIRDAARCRLEPEGDGTVVRPMADSMVHLTRSYRFGGESGIAALSRAVNRGEGDLSLGLLKEGGFRDVLWKPLPPVKGLSRALRAGLVEGFRGVFRSTRPLDALEGLDRFRVLCALREGPFGVHAVNLLAERILREEGFIRASGRWYPGRPVLITRNHYELRLFNGDVGVALPDEGSRELRVFFAGAEGEMRGIHPSRLPEHETVYAMTVHKSQGSEFDRVLLLLPDKDSPVLTRELIYTAITRAREAVDVWGSEEVFRTALTRRIERRSGLREALWED